MNDVWLLFLEECTQHFDLTERTQAFFMDGQCDVAAPVLFELLDQSPAIGHDDRVMSFLDQMLTDLKRASFDTSGVQFGE